MERTNPFDAITMASALPSAMDPRDYRVASARPADRETMAQASLSPKRRITTTGAGGHGRM